MSNRSSGSMFASSTASDESFVGTLPIVTLLEDVNAYAGSVFDISARTIKDLQTMEQLKSYRGEYADWRKLDEREVLLTGFLRRIEQIQQELTDIRRADFMALSPVWNSGAELIERPFQDVVNALAGIELQVADLREDLEGNGHAYPTQARKQIADELLARQKSLMDADRGGRAMRHRRDLHPCRGGLRLIQGEDGGGIDRCLRKDLKPAEIERLDAGGNGGTYLFWKCDSCEFRVKYFVSKSRTASLTTNDDHLTFKDSKVRCSQAFLAMSHLEQRDMKRMSSFQGPPRYTCIICALHRQAAKPGSSQTFPNRNDYAKHIENTHINGNLPPAFVLDKLGIENSEKWSDERRKELWISQHPAPTF